MPPELTGGSVVLRTTTDSGGTRGGSEAHLQEDGPGEDRQAGLLARRPERSATGHPRNGSGVGVSGEIRDGERTRYSTPQAQPQGIGSPASCPGEALLWGQSEYLVGTGRRCGKRGGLGGKYPEALCGEAPKGQPEIRRENLEAVCAEAPQGQPRKHRPHSKKPHGTRPTGAEQGRLRRKDPPSSRWRKVGERESGDSSRVPMHGELQPSGRTWIGE